MTASYVIAIGANLGNRIATMERAISLLAQKSLAIRACAAWYRNRAVGHAKQEFINSAILVSSELTPLAVLRILLDVELSLGRNRLGPSGDRTIDLDLIVGWDADGEEIIVNSPPMLELPHPRARERDFVMLPLADLLPEKRFSNDMDTFSEIAKSLLTAAMQKIRDSAAYN